MAEIKKHQDARAEISLEMAGEVAGGKVDCIKTKLPPGARPGKKYEPVPPGNGLDPAPTDTPVPTPTPTPTPAPAPEAPVGGGNTQTNSNGSKGNQQVNTNGDNNASF